MKNLKSIKTGITLAATACFVIMMSSNAIGQCGSWEDYPEGADKAKEKHVLYRDLFKAKKYEEALIYFEPLFEHVKIATNGTRKLSRHFKDGIYMYKKIRKAIPKEEKEKRKEYADKIMSIYDEYIACFEAEKGKATYKKGLDMNYMAYGEVEERYRLVKEGTDIEGNKTSYTALESFASIAVKAFKKEKATKEQLRETYMKIKEIAEYNIANISENKLYAKDPEKYKGKFQTALEKAEKRFAPVKYSVFDCEYFVGKYEPQYNADPENEELRLEILKILKKAKCETTNAFVSIVQAKQDAFVAEEKAKNREIWLANNPQAAAMEAKKAGDIPGAIKLFETAIAKETDNKKKADYAYNIADMYYRKGNYSKSRSFANKAAGFRPGWGDPYLLIGTLYASSGKRCGSGTGWDSQVVVWAAIDKWNRAKSVDPSVAATANKKIAQYSKYMPSKEDVFQRNLKSGSSYKVGCWIGETTTIRTK